MPNNTTFKKQGTVGSLSFNVIDTSSPKQSTELSRPVASGDVQDSVNKGQEQIVARKPAPRAKVPFEKGYSQMDWLKLTRTHPDLAGTGWVYFLVNLLHTLTLYSFPWFFLQFFFWFSLNVLRFYLLWFTYNLLLSNSLIILL